MYPTDLIIAPLTSWPGASTQQRVRAPFRAPDTDTQGLLKRELTKIGAHNTVLEVAIPPGQFRIDGRPRADARADHPGVVLSLPTSRVGALRYATDRYERWQDNLRAIALGMEALRMVDRYGITSRHEQYAGFRAITAAPAGPDGFDTPDEAWAFIVAAAELNPDENDPNSDFDVDYAYKRAARRWHPDRSGGDTVEFQRLQDAMRVLRAGSAVTR